MTKNKNEKPPAVNANEDKPTSKRLKTSKPTNESLDTFVMPTTGKEIVFETSVSKNDMIHNKDSLTSNTQQEASLENLDKLSGEANQNIFINNEKHHNKIQEVAPHALVQTNTTFSTSPSKKVYANLYKYSVEGAKLDFNRKENEEDAEDNMDLPDEISEKGEANDEFDDQYNKSEVAFSKKKIAEKQYGKYDSITKEEIFAVNNYCRESLWRRAKFINDRQLGDEFNTICTNEDIAPENRNHKYVDIILLIQNNMNYRRSYTTKRMRELMVAKSLDGTMFDVSLLNEFYAFDENSGEEFSVSEDVKNAYYIFIKDFCPIVSSYWRKYLCKLCQHRETATFYQQLTKSDEAFSYWLITCLEPKVKSDTDFINTNGMSKWNEVRKRGKGGKHDSNVKFDEYVNIFNKIDVLRNKQKAYTFWMDIFFDQFFKDYQKKKLHNNDKDTSNVEVFYKDVEIPKGYE